MTQICLSRHQMVIRSLRSLATRPSGECRALRSKTKFDTSLADFHIFRFTASTD